MPNISNCSNPHKNDQTMMKLILALNKITVIESLGEQGWSSGESTRLAPLLSGFKFWCQPYVG